MKEKPMDPEAPSVTHHRRSHSTISIEKQEVINEEVAQSWTREQVKNDKHTKQKNPLAGLTKDELLADVEAFAQEKNLTHILDDLKKGALIAQDPKSFESLTELSEGEKEILRREKTHRWSQPFMMYFMTSKFCFYDIVPILDRILTFLVLCAGSAIVQGMDQTAVNGAQECVYSLGLDGVRIVD